MPLEKWESLVRGENCPLCAAVRSTGQADAYAFTVADFQSGRLQLARNQFISGYCVYISREHVREPYHLSALAAAQFFAGLMHAARAVEKVFQPLKMNIEILGNTVPHLHAHLIPRYYGDPAPGRPIDPASRIVILDSSFYAERVRQLREALSGLEEALS